MHENEFPIKPFIPPLSACVFEGTRFDVYSLNRGVTKREVINHPGAVIILPLIDETKVVLIKNERFSVGETLWELPAGTLEKDEEPGGCALRELKEETGYSCQCIEFLTFFYTTPGFCNERMFAYAASGLTLGAQQLDETENITIEVFSWEQIMEMVKNATIRDSKTITTLLFYKLLKGRQGP